MNQKKTSIKRALISVSNKTGIVEFARGLAKLDIEIISTGGTSHLLREAQVAVRDVSEITGFPEMMDGRIKTLHPNIHGGILGQRDQHAAVARQHQIEWIDLVIVNLYPFAETIKKADVSFNEAIENIDIGGPTMIRAAAKNMGWVGVVVDPVDYTKILTELQAEKGLSFHVRRQLATKAFAYTAHYDAMIHAYLDGNTFPDQLNLHLEKYADLRYGENPHQTACAYRLPQQAFGILSAKQHQGKLLSYNNIADADAAVACVREFQQPACVIVKHANPCGVGIADEIGDAFLRAIEADSISAFGGIIALNRPCDKKMAEAIGQVFFEVVVAPAYTLEALSLLATKQNLRLLELDVLKQSGSAQEFKFIDGGFLVQEKDVSLIEEKDLKVVTSAQPTVPEIEAMLFAWGVLKHIKSNAILIAKTGYTVGIGAGQVSRVDAVDIAIRKAGNHLLGTILASDAFFPFRDSIDRIANTGIRAIIQPGGSVRDEEVIQACNEHHIAMVFTGMRCFKH